MATSGSATASRRQVLERYRHLHDEHLRDMRKWGLVRPHPGADGDLQYGFADLAVFRQTDAALAGGTRFRAVVRTLLATRGGQLAFDFRTESQPAKVLALKRPEPPPLIALMAPHATLAASSAEHHFLSASRLDNGDPATADAAMAGYRHALGIEPDLVPAIINLANIHYARDEAAEAQAMYERAIGLDRDVFEAHFNLGNILHDLGRFADAQARYREALRLNPTYADAHFYLAVTLEKGGRSQEARPHWRAYQQLAPHGEWVNLAREFSD